MAVVMVSRRRRRRWLWLELEVQFRGLAQGQGQGQGDLKGPEWPGGAVGNRPTAKGPEKAKKFQDPRSVWRSTDRGTMGRR